MRRGLVCTLLALGVILTFVSSGAWAKDIEKARSHAALVVSLYDELMQAHRTGNFQRYGFAPGGPYHDLLDRIDAASDQDQDVFFTDFYQCTASELNVFGMYLINPAGHEDYIRTITDRMEDCRSLVRR